MAFQKPEVNIVADEVNALIHSYLVDSGFIHSAFVLRGEANLDRSPLSKVLFPRGQLTEFLAKALLYLEVEAHWKQVPGSCNESFSLTAPHNCKLTPAKNVSALATSFNFWGEESNIKDPWPQGEDEAMEDSSTSSELPAFKDHELPSNLHQMIPIHEREIFQCAWNPVYTDILATGSRDSHACIMQVDPTTNNRSGDEKIATIIHCAELPLDGERDVAGLDWSRDGSLLATASMDSYVRVWSKEKRQLLFSSQEHTDVVGAVRFSPNGKYLISVSLDFQTIVWDVEKQTVARKYPATPVNGMVQDQAWISDTSFAVSWPGSLIHLFLTTAPMAFRTFRGHTDVVNTVRVSPDRKLLASASDDHTVRIWTIRPFKMMVKDGDIVPAEGSVGGEEGQDCLHVLKGHESPISGCRWGTFVPGVKEKLFMSVAENHSVCMWDAETGNCLKQVKDHDADIWGLGASPSAEYFVTTSVDGWLYIYSSKTWEIVCSWTDRAPVKGRKRGLYEVDWHKDGKKLAVCTASGDIALLDVSHLNAKPAPASE